MNDSFSQHQETKSLPMGIEIKGLAYAFKTGIGSDSLNNVVFLHLNIRNFSNRNYSQVYAGIWTDIDIGYAFDDFIGCDTIRNMYYGYNADSFDEGTMGYGLNPPMQAIKFLNLPMSHFMYYNNDFSETGNPFHAIDYYNFLEGKWHNGQPMRYGGDGFNNIWVDQRANYAFPGDPRNQNLHGVKYHLVILRETEEA